MAYEFNSIKGSLSDKVNNLSSAPNNNMALVPFVAAHDRERVELGHQAPGAWADPQAVVHVQELRPLLLLPIGGQQLREFCHNALQHGAIGLPGRNTLVVRGMLTEAQVRSHRPSYINALLIQSRGTWMREPCTACQNQMQSSQRRWARPFPICVRLPGHFGGCCGNCKWRDHAGRCSVRDAGGSAGGPSPPPLPPPPSPQSPGSAQRPILLIESGAADDPIVL